MIYEKDKALSLLLTTILNLQGYDTNVIKNRTDLYVNYSNPAVIIIDAGTIEKLEGLELCKNIKQSEEFNKSKLIVTSIIHDKELILSSGADLYLPKPYEISSLIKWVDALIKELNN